MYLHLRGETRLIQKNIIISGDIHSSLLFLQQPQPYHTYILELVGAHWSFNRASLKRVTREQI